MLTQIDVFINVIVHKRQVNIWPFGYLKDIQCPVEWLDIRHLFVCFTRKSESGRIFALYQVFGQIFGRTPSIRLYFWPDIRNQVVCFTRKSVSGRIFALQYPVPGQIFGLITSIRSNSWLDIRYLVYGRIFAKISGIRSDFGLTSCERSDILFLYPVHHPYLKVSGCEPEIKRIK